MKFTESYLDLAKNVQEAKYKIIVNYTDQSEVLSVLDNLAKQVEVTHLKEREAGNTTDVDNLNPEFYPNGDRRIEDPRQNLQFQIDQTALAIAQLCKLYTVVDYAGTDELKEALEYLAYSSDQPLTNSPEHLASFLNYSMDSFVEQMGQLTEDTLKEDDVLYREVNNIAWNLTISIKESGNPQLLNDIEPLATIMFKLGLDNQAKELIQ